METLYWLVKPGKISVGSNGCGCVCRSGILPDIIAGWKPALQHIGIRKAVMNEIKKPIIGECEGKRNLVTKDETSPVEISC